MNVYKYEDVYENALRYFEGDKLSADAWINKYALKNKQGDLLEESPLDMHKRLASEFARIERKYENPMSEDEIFELLNEFKYAVPQGGPMMGIGNKEQVVSISNCFVIGSNEDSYGAILKTDQEQIQLMKRRGGVGHDLSHLRPDGAFVRNSALTSTGPISFMKRYSNSTREVGQDGRRGALMLSMDIKHPNVEGFIDAKLDKKEVTGANISVRISDEYMQCVESNEKYTQQFPLNSDNPEIINEIEAKRLWDKLIYNAWDSAEPGILFWDTIKRESIPDVYKDHGFETVSTNPCGEIPLCPYDSCRLLAINLYSYVVNPYTEHAAFDFNLFKEHSEKIMRLMDDMIDLELEKIDGIIEKISKDPEDPKTKQIELDLWIKIKEMAINGRRTGLGITAEGDMLAALGLKYGTREATEFSIDIHKTLATYSYISSIKMAKERGAFEVFNYHKEKDNPFIQRVMAEIEKVDSSYIDMWRTSGRRNIALLTIAPTGTTSMMTRTSSGLEPVFMISYKRRRKINPNDRNAEKHFEDEVGDFWEEYNVFHPKFEKYLEANGYDYTKTAFMSQEEIDEIIKQSPYHGALANDIDWEEKVYMQGAIQKWVDHSISVTVNLPKTITKEEVSNIYLKAWKYGCKGMTVYRDGSRSGFLISNDDNKKLKKAIKENAVTKRPKSLPCDVMMFQNNKEPWIGFLGKLEDRPYEIFTGRRSEFPVPNNITEGEIIKIKDNGHGNRYDFKYIDKNGEEIIMEGLNRVFIREYWNYAKLVSGLLRHGMPIEFVINTITDLNWDENEPYFQTWKAGVTRMIKKYIKDGTKSAHECPDCGQHSLVYEEGCLICKNCGNSKCG
jgi:ribonucleoside-diphosphate reductase alpha chain